MQKKKKNLVLFFSPDSKYQVILPCGYLQILTLQIFLSHILIPNELGCSSSQFRCTNGQCVSSSSQCTGIETCFDGSDEMNCSKLLDVHFDKYQPHFSILNVTICTASCQNGAFWCSSDQLCISSSKRCNGVRSCSDGSDEMNCSKFWQLPTDVPNNCWVYFNTILLQFLQLLVKVERFIVAMVNVSFPLVTVIGIKTALMAVMRLDVVSFFGSYSLV